MAMSSYSRLTPNWRKCKTKVRGCTVSPKPLRRVYKRKTLKTQVKWRSNNYSYMPKEAKYSPGDLVYVTRGKLAGQILKVEADIDKVIHKKRKHPEITYWFVQPNYKEFAVNESHLVLYMSG